MLKKIEVYDAESMREFITGLSTKGRYKLCLEVDITYLTVINYIKGKYEPNLERAIKITEFMDKELGRPGNKSDFIQLKNKMKDDIKEM